MQFKNIKLSCKESSPILVVASDQVERLTCHKSTHDEDHSNCQVDSVRCSVTDAVVEDALSLFEVVTLEDIGCNLDKLNYLGRLKNEPDLELENITFTLERLADLKVDNEVVYLHLSAIRLKEGRRSSAQSFLRKAIRNCEHAFTSKIMLVAIMRQVKDNHYSSKLAVDEILFSDKASDDAKSLAAQALILLMMNSLSMDEILPELGRLSKYIDRKIVPWIASIIHLTSGNGVSEIYEKRFTEVDLAAHTLFGCELFWLVEDWVDKTSANDFSVAVDLMWVFDYPGCEGEVVFGIGDALSRMSSYASDKAGDPFMAILSLLYSNPKNPLYSSETSQLLAEALPKYSESKLLRRKFLLSRWWSGIKEEGLIKEMVDYDRSFIGAKKLFSDSKELTPESGRLPRNIISIRSSEIISAFKSIDITEKEKQAIWEVISDVVKNYKNQHHTRILKAYLENVS